MARTGFYPGSFDPVTFGHLDIIGRAAGLVDRLVLGIGVHHGKQPFIDTETRITLLNESCAPITANSHTAIEVVTFNNLAIDAAAENGANIIFRGLRDASDFDYEVQMAQMNAAMSASIETVFLAASPATRMIASSLVKQIAKMGGDISAFVPTEVNETIKAVLKS